MKSVFDYNNIHLDRDSAIPLYYQLKEQVKTDIIKGQCKPNDRLPTEEELCKQLSISRPVVRQAYDELIKEGLVIRRKGSGTFVKQRADKNSLFKEFVNFSFEKNIKDVEKESKIVKIEKIIDPQINLRLGIHPDSEVLHIMRICHELEYPISMIESYLPCIYFASIENYIFMAITKPIIDIVESMYGIYIRFAKRSLNAIEINEEKAAFLHGHVGDLAFEIETKYQDGFSRVVMLEYVTYLTSKMQFSIGINRK